jgi:adenine deaminase
MKGSDNMPTPAPIGPDDQDLQKRMDVALGRKKADLIITNARLVNVYTGEILDDISIDIVNQIIAYVGPFRKESAGPQTEVIDAGHKTVIPGLIDGHTHLAWIFSASEFLKHAMKGGTTTIITETMEPYPVAGLEGVIDFLGSLERQPIKLFATAPAMMSISRAVNGIRVKDLRRLLQRRDILGLGESYWQNVIQTPDKILSAFKETLEAGKALEGHTAGAKGAKLNAYVAAGISSCHEPINADQVLERLRLGLYIMVREGSIRRDLESIAKIKETGIDFRRLILVTDGLSPRDLLEKGHMEYIVQRAVDLGIPPVKAIQMATLNVAEHFGLDHLIGGVAPGKCADLVLIPDEKTISAEVVISGGRVIAQNGTLQVAPQPYQFDERNLNTIHLKAEKTSADFVVRAKKNIVKARTRVIDMVTDLVTRELTVELPVINGEIMPIPEKDILKIAAIDRGPEREKAFTGFIHGFGMKSGAFACSAAWDTSDIIVIGVNEADMAVAVNRIRQLQGGAVVCDAGNILAELPLPIFGIMSALPLAVLIKTMDNLKHTVAGLGVVFPDPLLSLITLTGAAIPYFRICEEGLVNLKEGRTYGLIID